MGLAASQGRLLLLTARKSDLEFRAQSISQARLILARDQEGVAKKYSEAISNTCFKFTVNKLENGNNTVIEEDFTLANFFKYKDQYAGYRLVGPDGKPIDANGNGSNLTAAQKEALKNDKGGADSILKFLIETGTIRLQKQNEADKTKWDDTSIAGETKFRDTLYTDDDKVAETQYNADMQRIKVKDQQLEMELKGIETQHKAVETEYESVQKVIQKNIEVSFKIFS